MQRGLPKINIPSNLMDRLRIASARKKTATSFEINAHGELQTLRAGAFDAVVLSLVLSFLPTPELRRDTCPTSMIFMSAIVLVSPMFPYFQVRNYGSIGSVLASYLDYL